MVAVEYLTENLWGFQFLGFNKLKAGANLLVKVWHKSFRFFCISFTLYTLALCVMGLAKRTDVEISMLTFAIYLGIFVRISYYYVFDGHAVRIVEMMNDLFRSSSMTGLKEKTMKRYQRVSHALVVFGFVLDAFTSWFSLFVPILKAQRILPVPFYYPYDWTKFPYYELTYFTQFVNQSIMLFSYFNADVFFMSVSILTTGQFEILGWEFTNSLYHVLLKNGVSKDMVENFKIESSRNCGKRSPFPEIENVLGTRKFRDDLRTHFTDLIRFHQKLLAFCDEVESFFSPYLLLTIPNCVSFTIFIGYGLVMSDNMPLRFILGIYFFTSLFQVFWPTLFAHLLGEQCAKLRDHIFECPWYLCDEEFKRDMRFVLLRTTKPFKVTLGRLIEFNLTVYLWIVRTSFSYITVLLQLTGNEE